MKTIEISIQAEIKDFGSQKVVSLPLNFSFVKDLCLGAILLNEDLIDGLGLVTNNMSMFLKLSLMNESKYTDFDTKKGIFKGFISKNSLEYMIHFLLKYYRDGFGEAEHIDIDFVNESNICMTLTIKTDSFKEYSSEDMNKMLGI